MVATLSGGSLNGPQILGPTYSFGGNYATIRASQVGQRTFYALIDNGRTQSGTMVNGKRLRGNRQLPYLLSTGDRIRIGQTQYTFEYSPSGAMLSGPGFNQISLGQRTTLGRDHSSTIEVPDIAAASNHAVIVSFVPQQGQIYALTDSGVGGNGTFVNGKQLRNNRQAPQILNSGDEIRIGNRIYTYSQNDSPARAIPANAQSNTSSASGNGGGGWIVIAVLLILAIAGYSSTQNHPAQGQSTPQNTLTAFCSAVKGGNYQTAYNQLSKKAQSQGTEAQFAAQLKQIFAQQGGLKDCKVGKVQTKGDATTGTITYVFKNGKTQSYSDTLVNESNSWKISSSQH